MFNKQNGHLPMCIGALLNLRSFSASDNPLKEPPDDIINGKNSSKLTYNYMRWGFSMRYLLVA